MGRPNRVVSSILVIADESADWRCAGLLQIDRLLLGLNEWIDAVQAGPVPVWIESARGGSTSIVPERVLPKLDLQPDAARFCQQIANSDAPVLVLSTHLVIHRGAKTQILSNWIQQCSGPICVSSARQVCDAITSQSLPAVIKILGKNEHDALSAEGTASSWYYLRSLKDVSACETLLLRESVKPQDGLIARYINRPLSRALTRLLLRTRVSPNEWTILIMALPLVGAIFFARGDYFGFAVGAVLFELHSVFDGCDGEIARLKFLASETGSKLDEICDRLSTLIYAFGLGIGLFHQAGVSSTLRWFYPAEAIFAAVVIGIGETILTTMPLHAFTNDEAYPDYTARNQQNFNPGDHLKLWVIRHSRMMFLGERATLFFSHATKRDVFNFLFLLLALCGLPALILHLLAFTAVIILILAAKKLLQPRLFVSRASVEID